MIRSYQGLRVISMICIFFYHCGFLVGTSFERIYSFFYDGHFAVTFFFILSGFLTYRSLIKTDIKFNMMNSIKFMFKKLSKFYPLHILMLIIFLIISYMPGLFLKQIIYHLPNAFFISSYIPIRKIYFSGNGVSWYISTVTFSYLLSLLFIKIIKNLRYFGLKILIIGVYIFQLVIICFGIESEHHIWLFYVNPFFRSLDFFIGMILSKILLENKINLKRNIFKHLEFVVIILFIIMYLNAWRVPQAFRWGTYFTPIIIYIMYIFYFENGIITKILGTNIFQKLSKISFEFYMVHQIVIAIYIKSFNSNPMILLILSLITSIILAKILNKCLSRKINIWNKKQLSV